MSNLTVVYAKEPLPTEVRKTIFLAGPTPRDNNIKSWRPAAIHHLEELGFDGHVFVPEDRDGTFKGDYDDQVMWETDALNRADVIAFWVPRNMKDMPALTTNVEWGMWADSGKAVIGWPGSAEKIRYLQRMAGLLKVPTAESLENTMAEAILLLGEGALRVEGEAQVPLLVWRLPVFQRWYASQKAVGNKLTQARVLWNCRVGPGRNRVFCWVLHVHVWIKAENRVKGNEFVFSRSDISAVALYYQPGPPSTIWDTEVLLVREFRSPARTLSGYIVELPGGSAKNNTVDTLQVALDELREETSFCLDPSRLRNVGTFQVAGTLSAHTCTLFSGRLSESERDHLHYVAVSGMTFGVEADTERTYVEVKTLSQILDEGLLDWSNLGMLLVSTLPEQRQ
jgi:8-oxo-dGTP pyrophosphatase MutT (NUDIX family)